MPPLVEWQLWRQLRGAFKIKRMIFTPVMPELEVGNYPIKQFATMEEALASADGERAFLEPKGCKDIDQLPQGDIVLVFGNTGNDNMKYANVNETYSIASTERTHLYPTEAAAIALYERIRPQLKRR